MGLVTVALASADSAGRKFKHLTDETFTSPDGQLRVEQYSRTSNDDTIHQFWTFDQKRRGSLLNRNEDTDLAGYPAGSASAPTACSPSPSTSRATKNPPSGSKAGAASTT